MTLPDDEKAPWTSVTKDPLQEARVWLQKHVKTRILETRAPTRTPGVPGIQVIVCTSAASVTPVLRVSGTDGVFTREFYDTDEDRQRYRTVPCAEGSTSKAALEQAAHM